MIHRKFMEVRTVTKLLAGDYIRTATRQELMRVLERLHSDRRYYPFQ
ncbi:unnamed protein product [Brassica rapa subsp. trilocularis]